MWLLIWAMLTWAILTRAMPLRGALVMAALGGSVPLEQFFAAQFFAGRAVHYLSEPVSCRNWGVSNPHRSRRKHWRCKSLW